MLKASNPRNQGSAGSAWGDNSTPYSNTSLKDVLEASQHADEEVQSPARWADIISGASGPGSRAQGMDGQRRRHEGISSGFPSSVRQPQKHGANGAGTESSRMMPSQQASSQHLRPNEQTHSRQSAQPHPRPPKTGASSHKPTSKVSLADFLSTSSGKRGSRITPAMDLQLSERQLKNVRGLVKAYPNKKELANAIKGRLRSAVGKKKLSPSKKLIVREKTKKAVAGAAEAVAAAKAALQGCEKAEASVRSSWQEAGSRLANEQLSGRTLQPSLLTQVQVLEMAATEAERRVQEARRKLQKAEEELAKAEAAHAKAWKVPSPEDATKAEKASDPFHQPPPARPERIATLASATTSGKEPGETFPANAASSHLRKPQVTTQAETFSGEAASLSEDDDSDDEQLEGLQGFENVLANWLHDANEKASASFGPLHASYGMNEKFEEGSAGADHEMEEVESDGESDGMGPDGWDDVLSAWMTNAGLLEHDAAKLEDQSASRSRSASPTPARKSQGGANPSPASLAEPLPTRSSTVEASAQGPQPHASAFSPSTAPTTPDSASYASYLLARSGGSGSYGRPSQNSPAATSDRLHDMNMFRGGNPQPLLADVLAGGQLSNEALLDLRVSLADNLSMQSEDDDQQSNLVSARVGGGGAVNLPPFPSRHSDVGSSSSSLRPHHSAHSLRPQHSWGPWSGNTNINAGRWSDNGPVLPRLQSADQASLLGQREMLLRGGNGDEQRGTVDLFGRAASIGALADLGLSRLPNADAQLQGSKLYHNVLTAAQQQMLENLPAPNTPQDNMGMTSPLRPLSSLSSMTGGDVRQSGPSSNWPPQNRSAASPELQANADSHHPLVNHHMQQQYNSQMHGQMPPIFTSQWGQPGHLSQYNLEPSPFQGMPNPGPMNFQDPQSWVDQQFPNPFANNFNQNELSDQMRAAQIGRMMQGPNYDLQQGFYPDIFAGQRPPHLPAHNSYPQANMQDMHGLNGGMDPQALSDLFALRSLLSAESATSMYGDHLNNRASGQSDWNNLAALPRIPRPQDASPQTSHDFHCDVCKVTCCGLMNFQQHCNSKKHLRKTASAGTAAIPEVGSPGSGEENDGPQALNPTYVGLQAQCRNYCKQVISTELNNVVVELLQQLLFWQERSKAINIHNAAKKKRLVSGLREVAKAIKLQKAKTVIVTPNIEQIETEGGLDDLLASILVQAERSSCPVVFALSRKKLGQVFGCRKKMSAIAILDYAGAESLFKQMEQHAEEGRREWETNHKEGTETDHGDLGSETIDQLSGAGAPMLRQEGSENLQPNSGQGTPQRESTQTAVGES